MAINFPNSPSVNDIHVSGSNRWQWNGSSWTRIGGVNSDSDSINSTNDNSTTTLYPVMVSGTGDQTAKISTSATKNISFDASEGDLTVGGNISVGGTATFTGSISVGGTATYEDVRNVDSIGIVTARAGVIVTGNLDTDTLNVSGVSTVTGLGATDISVSGIVTAASGQLISGVGIRTAGGTVGWAATILDFRGPGVTTAYYSSVTGVGTVHFTGGGGSASVSISESAPSSPSAGDMWWDSDVGNLQIYYTDSNSSQWVTANNSGPQGPQGAQGATGAQGHQGVQGAQGHQGVQGAVGAQGAQGAQGHQGRQGSVGIASLTISTGAPSSPAQGDMWWDSDDGDLHLYFNDGSSSQWVNINAGSAGAQGVQGATGSTGAQGYQGVQGANGAAGAQGAQGVQGAANATTINNNADNRVITGSGTANTLEGESQLLFTGTNLGVGNRTSSPDERLHVHTSSGQANIHVEGATDGQIILRAHSGNSVIHFGDASATSVGKIYYEHSNDEFVFNTSANERVRITASGLITKYDTRNVSIRNAAGTTRGHLQASGNGIDLQSHVNSSGFITFSTNGGGTPAERVRITSDGSLLIGNSAATFSSPTPSLNIEKTSTGTGPLIFLYNGQSANTASTCEIRVGQNYREANRIVFGRENNSNWQASAGSVGSYMGFYTNSAGTLAERLRIASNGKVSIAPAPYSGGGTVPELYIRGGSGRTVKIHNPNSATAGIQLTNATTGEGEDVGFFIQQLAGGDAYFSHIVGGKDIVFRTKPSSGSLAERVRIRENGEVDISDNVVIHSVGNSQAVDIEQQTNGNYMNMRLRNFYTGSAKNMIAFLDQNGNVRGSIVINNSNTTYNTSSDYRLKENEVPISDGIERLKLLKPYRFNWKEDPSITLDGFFAHEVTPAVPEAVVNEKDGEIDEEGNGYQQMDYAKITPLLTAALQEAIAEIETLKAEVATLKSS